MPKVSKLANMQVNRHSEILITPVRINITKTILSLNVFVNMYTFDMAVILERIIKICAKMYVQLYVSQLII